MIVSFRCIVTFNQAACFRAARQSTPVEFDYPPVGIGVGVGDDDHDDDVDERKASSRMPVFPSISSVPRNRPTEILTVRRPASSASRCISILVAHGTGHPCSRLLARDSAILPPISSIHGEKIASDAPLKRAHLTAQLAKQGQSIKSERVFVRVRSVPSLVWKTSVDEIVEAWISWRFLIWNSVLSFAKNCFRFENFSARLWTEIKMITSKFNEAPRGFAWFA